MKDSLEIKLKNVENSVALLESKQNKIMFFVPDIKNQASGGIGVVYQHAKTLIELGYNAVILHEKSDYVKPDWMGKEFGAIPHISLDKPEEITVNASDFLLIPEGFPNIMEQVKGLPCKNIVFAQSWSYILPSMLPTMTWADFNITDVLTVSPVLVQYMQKIFRNNTQYKVISPGISDQIFTKTKKTQTPVIAISTRNQVDTIQIAKQFYLEYPHYKWVTFQDMHGMTRKEFAEKLGESCIAVWVDRIAGFGTFPIEAAKCGIPTIGVLPEILPEFVGDGESSVWVNGLMDIPAQIDKLLSLWLEDSIPQSLFNNMDKMAANYSSEKEKEQVAQVYGEYVSERIEQLKALAQDIKNQINSL